MLDPTSLFTWDDFVDQRTVRARTLVVTLGHFADVGHTQRILDTHLLESLPNHVLGRFDIDQLHDYAGRRPQVVFDRDHFEHYSAPEIALRLVTDAAGADFLLLSGPEPSLQWERMAAAVGHLADQLGVEQTVLVQSMPSPTPHTRPVAVSRFATDPHLLPDNEPYLGTFGVSASFNALLTLRLGEGGHDAVGLLAHVPHYLADSDYPAGALALVNGLLDVANLDVPKGALTLASAAATGAINAQVSQSEELTELVATLEESYDSFVAGRKRLPAPEDLPSADELGAEVEDFLRGLGPDAADDTPAESG